LPLSSMLTFLVWLLSTRINNINLNKF
jgi:hypothetical protein